MGDWYASENYTDDLRELVWLYRKRTFWEKIKEFFFGKETIEHHFRKESK